MSPVKHVRSFDEAVLPVGNKMRVMRTAFVMGLLLANGGNRYGLCWYLPPLFLVTSMAVRRSTCPVAPSEELEAT